jgi:NAD(P)-dependent dehydrogenase (short-subunit alcohol dehydrogenase family)
MRFQGKVALITGAGGIGRATAEIIGREGGTVVAVDVDRGALEGVVGAIRVAGGDVHGEPADALDAPEVTEVVRRHGRAPPSHRYPGERGGR